MDDSFKSFVIFISALVAIIMVIVTLPIVGFEYYAACNKASVFNRLNGTDFTCGDFFWASSQINEHTSTLRVR